MQPSQDTLDFEIPDSVSNTVQAAVDQLALNSEADARGAIFTRREVVELILNIVGYTEDKPLCQMQILEPSFGVGDFLLPIVERLLRAWASVNTSEEEIFNILGDSIRAVELHQNSYASTYSSVINLLEKSGIPAKTASKLTSKWLSQGDFLLTSLETKFDFIVGNPPYIRQEMIPAPLLVEYRARYQTMYDRADIYIPFIERSLSLLLNGGALGFICSDRWMKNRYGGPLRKLIADNFRLKAYVDMVDTAAFHSEVSAYPAITVISAEPPASTRVAHRPNIERDSLIALAKEINASELVNKSNGVREIAYVTNGHEPWLLDSSDQTEIIRRLESNFSLLEEAGCKVGIGVATGADKVFIADYESLDVESDRKLPLATTKDIVSGEVEWLGKGVINPFSENGGLVDLNKYPRLSRFLDSHKDVIAGRHCAQKSPANWYRTIDRIYPDLAATPKLLIPDIKGEAHIVFEKGELYPHHNLYYIVSTEWDLRALQAVLLSTVTRFFVASYSTKMRGGFLRFQAQYLRRIRIPRWSEVSKSLRLELANAAKKRDLEACNQAAFKLYGLSEKEQAAIIGTEN